MTIKITEVGARDGLQNEKASLSVETRVALIRRLAKLPFSEIEVGSFVSPKWVPQMACSDLVYAGVKDLEGPVELSCLVPNERGMQDAVKAGVKKISIFTAASETFNQKNINCSIAESFARFEPVLKLAEEHGMAVRGYISTAFVCPYEGDVEPHVVQEVYQRLLDVGVTDISIGDTIGKATTGQVKAVLERVLPLSSDADVALHLHDTYGKALENVAAGLDLGVTHFDSSTAGLGGCPYAPGAFGNLATENLVAFLAQKGLLDERSWQPGLAEAAQFINKAIKTQ